jgi:hypothetical protein
MSDTDQPSIGRFPARQGWRGVCLQRARAPMDGGLDAVTIAHPALDLRRGDGFTAHQLDEKLSTFLVAQVLDGPNCDT